MNFNPDPKVLNSISTARNVKEFESVLIKINGKLGNIADDLVDVKAPKGKMSLKSVSAKGDLKVHEMDGEISPKGVSAPSKRLNPTVRKGFPKEFPIMAELDESKLGSTKASTELLGNVESTLRELASMKQVVMGRGFKLKSKESLLKAIDSSGKEAQLLVRTAKRALTKVSGKSKGAIPDVHYNICNAAFNLLRDPKTLDHDRYTDIIYKRNGSNTTFVLSKSDTTYHIQTFIRIEDLVNDEGYSYEDYIVVVTGVLELLGDGDSIMNYYVTSIKEEKTPGSFPIGKTPITSPADFSRRVTTLLSIDGFLTTFDKKSVRRSTKDVRNSTRLGLKNITDEGVELASVRVAEGNILAHMKKGTEEEFKATVVEVIASIKAAFKLSKRDVVQYKYKNKRNGSRLYTFELVNDRMGQRKKAFTNSQLNMIADVLELDSAQKSELRNSIK